mgnify:CR=1 FL=1
MKLSNQEYKELSEKFSKAWELDNSKIEKHEKDFMQQINNIIFWVNNHSRKGDISLDCYDMPMLLSAIEKTIREFQNLYHIVHVTDSWKNEQ